MTMATSRAAEWRVWARDVPEANSFFFFLSINQGEPLFKNKRNIVKKAWNGDGGFYDVKMS